MVTGITQLDISSAGEVLVAMVERDMLCNLSRGGRRDASHYHPDHASFCRLADQPILQHAA